MKYLQTYEKFDLQQPAPPDIKAAMTAANQEEQNIDGFKKGKPKLQQIYKDYKDDETPSETQTPKDLANRLKQAKLTKTASTPAEKTQVNFKNPNQPDKPSTPTNTLFVKQAEVEAEKRKVTKYEETLQQKQKDLVEKQKALQQNQGDPTSLRTDIDNLNKDIADIRTKLNASTRNAQQLEQKAKKDLDLERKKLEDAKKTIQNLNK